MIGVFSNIFWRISNWILDKVALLYATLLERIGFNEKNVENINKWAFKIGPLIQLLATIIVVVIYVLPAELYVRAGILIGTMILLYDYWLIGFISEVRAHFKKAPKHRITRIEA